MATSLKQKRLLDAYRFTFFRPLEKIHGIFGDSKARIITLVVYVSFVASPDDAGYQ